MRRERVKGDLFWPLALVAAVVLALIFSSLLNLAHHFDDVARQREESIVANGFEQMVLETGDKAVAQVVWDDAVRNLDNRYNAAWAEENIGQFFTVLGDFSAALVLDADDRPLYGARGDSRDALAIHRRYAGAVAPVVAAVRAKEARRSAAASKTLADPIQASGLGVVNDDLYIFNATVVQPDFGHARPAGPRSPVVITALRVDNLFMDAVAKRFRLEDLHVPRTDSREEPGEAHLPLRSPTGAYIATVDWTPQKPGAVLVSRIGVPVGGLLIALALVALLLNRRANIVARGLIASEARATRLAFFDPLTGLPNRTRLLERLEKSLEALRREPSQRFALLSLDVRRFKEFNDNYGHRTCDQLIEEAARRLAACNRPGDKLARVGPDEFAIVQAGADAEAAADLARQLIQQFERPFDVDFGEVTLELVIGVMLVTDGAVESVEVLRRADLAMSRTRALSMGSDFGFFEAEMDASAKTRRDLEADLRKALANGELEMAYQPQVKANGVMTGVEALVRWRHPERGPVSPAYFVPVAEECGLIGELGLYTMAHAFQDSRRWKGIKVAINVSALQLRSPGFVTSVSTLVRRLRVDPRRFELEITETLLLGDDQDTHSSLQELRDLGFSLALDDFGTGYSNLGYLKRFPISKIKIDRSFVANLGVDKSADAMVGAIVRMARSLGLAVIAEGVETEEQRRRLRAAGCNEIQGFLYSRPVSAAEIDALRSGDPAPARLAA